MSQCLQALIGFLSALREL